MPKHNKAANKLAQVANEAKQLKKMIKKKKQKSSNSKGIVKVSGKGAYTFKDFGNTLKKVASPFVDSTESKGIINKGARAIGQALGDTINPVVGKGLGNAASWLSRAFGFGDYTVRSNTLATGNIAQFSNHGEIVFAHREFIADVNSSAGFVNTAYPINPGNATLFPWLSTIAKNFEQYEFLGLIFEFKSTSATAVGSVNTGLGTLIMATDYDVLDSKYQDKRAMEVADFSTSAAPCYNQIHPIECDPHQNILRQLYIQPGNNAANYPDDARFSALGNFQIATSGMQAVSTIGELWVSYHIRLLKPQLEFAALQSNTSLIATGGMNTAGADPFFYTTKTNQPGALGLAFIAGPKLVIQCLTSAGVGTYLMSYTVNSKTDVPDPSWINNTGNCTGSTFVTFPNARTGPDGIVLGSAQTSTAIAVQKSGATTSVNSNTQTFSCVFTFTAVGDALSIPQPYSAAAPCYFTMNLAPYALPFLQLDKQVSLTQREIEFRELREQVSKLQRTSEVTARNFVELKQEVQEELEIVSPSDSVFIKKSQDLTDGLLKPLYISSSPPYKEEWVHKEVEKTILVLLNPSCSLKESTQALSYASQLLLNEYINDTDKASLEYHITLQEKRWK